MEENARPTAVRIGHQTSHRCQHCLVSVLESLSVWTPRCSVFPDHRLSATQPKGWTLNCACDAFRNRNYLQHAARVVNGKPHAATRGFSAARHRCSSARPTASTSPLWETSTHTSARHGSMVECSARRWLPRSIRVDLKVRSAARPGRLYQSMKCHEALSFQSPLCPIIAEPTQ